MENAAEIRKDRLDAHTARQKVLENIALSDKSRAQNERQDIVFFTYIKKHSPQKRNHLFQHRHKQNP